MKKKILYVIIALFIISGIATALGSNDKPKEAPVEEAVEEAPDVQAMVEEFFEGKNFYKVDKVYNNEIHVTMSATDKDAAEIGISSHSDALAKKLQDHTDSLTIIYALPKLANVLEVRYEKQGGELVRTYFEYDV